MMKLSKLKTAITVLSGIFIFSLPFINNTSVVKAAWNDGYSDNIVQGSDGSLSATFIDKSATSDTRFKTMGYTITVKDPDTGATIGHAHVAFDGVDHTSMSPDGTKKFTQDSVSAAQVQAAFGALIDDNDNAIDEATTIKLYEQYMSGKANIQFDSIIAITTDGFKTTSTSTHYDDASKYAHFVMNSEYTTLMKKYGDTNGDGVFSVSEMAALQKIFPNTDFSTHYNKKLVTTIKNPDTKEAEEAQAKIDEASKSVETEKFAEYHTWDNQSGTDGVARSSSSPYYVTYNDSRKYSESGKSHEAFTDEGSDGIVIPSGEKYINGYTSDSYWGSASMGLGSGSHTWTFTYKYTYELLEYGDLVTTTKYYDANGDEVSSESESVTSKTTSYRPIKHLGTRDGSVTVPVTRQAYYYYIYDLDLYDFASSTTYNDTFGSDSLNYSSIEPHCLTDVAPSITGPVDSGVSTISNRPTYEIRMNNGSQINLNGTEQNVSSFAPNPDGHINWASIEFTESDAQLGFLGAHFSDPSSTAYEKGRTDAEQRVGNGDNIKTKTTGGTADTFATVTNDYLKLGYNGKVVLDGSTVPVIFTGSGYSYSSSFNANTAIAVPYLTAHYPSWISSTDTETYETSPAFGKNQTQIPVNQKNGSYATTVSSVYKAILAHSSSKSVTQNFGQTGNIKGSYHMNEPVKVQTPVISPVSLHQDTGKNDASSHADANLTPTTVTTQLAAGVQDSSLDQLKLDETYWFKFDERTHLETQGYKDSSTLDNAWDTTASKYDKYTRAKYVHFPFDVVLYTHNDDGTIKATYHKHTADTSSTDYWTKLENKSDWEWVKFYIPTWAKEGIYNDGEKQIQYKVESQNVIDDKSGDNTGDGHQHNEENEDSGNGSHTPDYELYVATYKIKVQISGWAYDFQVVGINDADTFDKSTGDSASVSDSWYAFCPNKEEKKAGVLNRLGGDSRFSSISNFIRYTLDGTLSSNWLASNTITMGGGSSTKYTDMGVESKGTKFAFSFKTISNLWNDNDSVQITPTFKYVKNGKTLSQANKDIYIYYHDVSGEYKQYYVSYGSTKDKALTNDVQLGSEEFDGSYYDSDIALSSKYPQATYYDNGDLNTFTYKKSGTDNDINDYKMKKVTSYTLSDITLSSGLRVFSGNVEQLNRNLDKEGSSLIQLNNMYETTDDEYTRTANIFKESMQTWYGEYYVPSELFVSTMSPSELQTYAENTPGGLAENDSKAWLQGGYLIVHFDITTIKNGVKDLVYAGSNNGQNMWVSQKYRDNVPVTTPKGTSSIHTDPGDIIVIDNSKSTNDKYKARVFMID